eukprot:3139445-Alexandrium_andersonii.AAC.1
MQNAFRHDRASVRDRRWTERVGIPQAWQPRTARDRVIHGMVTSAVTRLALRYVGPPFGKPDE